MAESHPIPTNPRFQDLTGQTFGRLIVVAYAGETRSKNRRWFCVCVCGKKTVVQGGSLKSGRTSSCGCFLLDKVSTHRQSRSSEFRTWNLMIQRCTNTNNTHYRDYGGRGIVVCDRWLHSFENFLTDMGKRPSPRHSIDRINNNGPYAQENCRWATRKQQMRNTRANHLVTFQGRTMPIIAWAEAIGMSKGSLTTRLARGWPVQRALTEPLQKRRR